MSQAADWADKHRDTVCRQDMEGGSMQGKTTSTALKLHTCLTYLLDSQETSCIVPGRSWNQAREHPSSCHQEGSTFCPEIQAQPLWRDRCRQAYIIWESEYGLIWSHCWSVWILLGKVRTLRPPVWKQHNSACIWPASNPWAAGSLQVCLGPEQPIGSHDTALPLFHWLNPLWSVGGIIFPSKELEEEVCSMMNAEVSGRHREGGQHYVHWHPVNKIPESQC